VDATAVKVTGSATSRSTSAGSSNTEDSRASGRRDSSASINAIPDYNYPVPLIVKNTFLETELWRPSSLDGFFVERQIRSCVSRLGDWQGGYALSAGDARLGAAQTTVQEVEEEEEFFEALEEIPEQPPACDDNSRAARWADEPLHAADEVAMDFPTAGSLGHFEGNCKPCAFFHTKGCRQGFQCEFCHLCDSSERKKRRKEKIALLREMRASVETEEY